MVSRYTDVNARDVPRKGVYIKVMDAVEFDVTLTGGVIVRIDNCENPAYREITFRRNDNKGIGRLESKKYFLHDRLMILI